MTSVKIIYRIGKRMFDCICSLAGLLVLWPVLFLIAAAIYIDDPHGCPFFIQRRVGKDGKIFTMYKFRTMIKDAEAMKPGMKALNEMDGPVFKVTNDPRITKIGGFLRKTGLDELPQLYNVLKGDMSFVGPRPPLPEEVPVIQNTRSSALRSCQGLPVRGRLCLREMTSRFMTGWKWIWIILNTDAFFWI